VLAGPVATLTSEEESDPPTYKDAFPPLPEKAACLENAQEPAGAWSNKIRPIKASVITQVDALSHFTCRSTWEAAAAEGKQLGWFWFWPRGLQLPHSLPRVEPGPLAVKAEKPDRWTTREIPRGFLNIK